MNRVLLAVLLFVSGGMLLGGCADTQAPCSEGLTRCGDTCVDLTSTSARCGACDVACSSTQTCAGGACACAAGTRQCGDACVITASDPAHCGGCAGEDGTACAPDQVCEQGQCKAACTLATSSSCGRSCVDLGTDAFHCGACDTVCADSRSCHEGVCTYDLVAACFNTGQVVGLQAETDARGPAVAVGTSPQSVARLRDVLLVLDASSRLLQARLTDYAPLPPRNPTGLVPNQVLVREPFVFVLNSTSNTLQVLRLDAASPSEGLTLTDVGSLNFGENTNPYAFALEGPDAYVTLLGNLQTSAEAGGKVIRVSLADPTAPSVTGTFVLPEGDALQPFPGHTSIPAAAGIAVRGGRVYAALGNLDPRDYSVGGPGFLARVDPTTGAVERVSLGDGCLNPFWVAPVGERLLVSCGGAAAYDRDFNLIDVRGTGLVLLGADDAVLDWHALGCDPEGACALPSAGRLSVVGERAYVADNNAGRLFVLEVVGDRLVERRGPASQPLLVCPRSAGPSLVGDVVAIP